MALASGTHTLGPDSGTLLVKTGREGAAARMGHDLTLEPERWTAKVVVDAAHLSRSRVTVTVDARSLVVREARGGAVPLLDRQRTEIATIIRSRVLRTSRHRRITFRSTAIAGGGAAATMTGDLTIAGTTRSVTVRLRARAGGTRITGATTVVQSEFAMEPYSAMLGTLRVKDAVEIRVDLRLPTSP
jgi:polyisoprenoid-binding protein YceI